MPPRKGESITIPISDAFANFLFEGRGETATYRIGDERIQTLVYSRFQRDIAGFEHLVDFVRHLSRQIQDEYKKKHSLQQRFADNFWVGINQMEGVIYLAGYPRGFGRLDSHRAAIVYGEWDDSSPHLKLRWLESNPRAGVIEAAKLLMKKLKEYDEIVSSKPNIGSRIRNTEETRQLRKNLLHLSDPGSERRALPESVLKHIANYVGEPEKKANLPAAALARLLSNNKNNTKKRGGARRKTTRRKH